ncbi:MAG: adenylate/guanylate cyclase domain-containing protein [Shinella sp.]|nr:MAG: adenylate/guanylate cyclase domain-containing protein [Shinella sp.]
MKRETLDAINDWVIEQGLLGLRETDLVDGFCNRLREGGLEIVEVALFFDTLHPVQESEGVFWNIANQNGPVHREFTREEAIRNNHLWRGSPFHYMNENSLSELHIPLVDAARSRFGIIGDLIDQGHTDYFVLMHKLGGKTTIGEIESIYSRWSTSQLGGFSEDDLEVLRKLVASLALAIKSASLGQIARSLVQVYLGRDPGRRVLEGRIERGKVETIRTVLWYSDMENYTSLSETMESGRLIAFLNDYADTVISAVHNAGGDILKLVGDGILAIFNHRDQHEAASAALQAQADVGRRIAELNLRRGEEGLATTSVYLALHEGEVFYGNVGSDERLDFTVIGPAVNEVCRMAAMCRSVNETALASREFAALASEEGLKAFHNLGSFQLKGVQEQKALFALRQ